VGVALVAGHNFYGYSDRIRRAFDAEGWAGRIEDVLAPQIRVTPRERILYRFLPQRLGIRGPLERATARTRADFVARVCAHDVDLILFIRPDLMLPEDLARIRAMRPRARLACWLMDPIGRMPGVEAILPGFDAVFLYDAADLDAARRLNPASHLLVLAFDPEDYRPAAPGVEDRWALSFIGSPSPARLRLLERVVGELGLGPDEVRFVVGQWRLLPLIGRRRLERQSWLFRDGFLDLETLGHAAVREIYHRSTLALNIHQVGTVSGFNMRVFEAAGAGAAQVVERLSGLDEELREGAEVACYGDADELVSQVRHLLEHPAEVAEMGRRAAAAAAARHTYRHRVRRILDAMDLS
jgi:glycosyltransferase involved in cell wall biosynthesis